MAHDMNPRDDEQDEEEMFVFAIAEMVQAGEVSKAKLHTRAYIEYVRPVITVANDQGSKTAAWKCAGCLGTNR